MPVHDIAGVVDIENDRRGLLFRGGHPLIDERPREPDRILQRGAFSTAIASAANTGSRRCQAAARKRAESEINVQSVEIVGIFISAVNCQDAGADHVRQRMRDPQRVVPIGKATRASFRDPNRRSAIASSMSPPSEVSRLLSNAAVHRPAADGWK